MDPHIQAIVQTDFSFPRETEETLRSIKKHIEFIEKACAQFSQDSLYATIQAKKEEEEVNHEDVVEHIEFVTKSSRDDHDLQCPVVANHTFPHLTPSDDEAAMSEEMQVDLIEKIAWRLALQSVLEEEEERERMRKEVVEESNSKEGRGVEEAIGIHLLPPAPYISFPRTRLETRL
ncbi:unnamed protein product [Linum trigynum]|uniref:Uncharacterized protein n=1 Tax=Linum trigynum TaxID=586398 RepID=A0AAV2E144_9ROSI